MFKSDNMVDNKNTEFRGLKNDFKSDLLKGGVLYPILDFEKDCRHSFLVEIRKNYLDLYFFGHAVKIVQSGSGYALSIAEAFRPDKFTKWPISFKEIQEKYASGFEEFMHDVMFKIIRHKEGDISEGVSEMNHYISNRIVYDPGDILVIDRQIAFGKARIDLLGLKKLDNGNFGFVIIELKNKENKDIGKVFSQTKEYIDVLWEHYNVFQSTYNLILEQKIELGLLDQKNKGIIADKPLSNKEIAGIVILDNYNLRSSCLERALKNDWMKIRSSCNMQLFLKTNTLDSRFFWNYEKTHEFFK